MFVFRKTGQMLFDQFSTSDLAHFIAGHVLHDLVCLRALVPAQLGMEELVEVVRGKLALGAFYLQDRVHLQSWSGMPITTASMMPG